MNHIIIIIIIDITMTIIIIQIQTFMYNRSEGVVDRSIELD